MTSLWLYKKQNIRWQKLALISLILTFCSGLQAISFWLIKADFDWLWWAPNLYLLIYPTLFIPKMLENKYA